MLCLCMQAAIGLSERKGRLNLGIRWNYHNLSLVCISVIVGGGLFLKGLSPLRLLSFIVLTWKNWAAESQSNNELPPYCFHLSILFPTSADEGEEKRTGGILISNWERETLWLPCLPKRSAPSFDAGCYGDRWHGHARSSFDRVGSHGTVGTGNGTPSYFHSGNKNIPRDGRLEETTEKWLIGHWWNVDTVRHNI